MKNSLHIKKAFYPAASVCFLMYASFASAADSALSLDLYTDTRLTFASGEPTWFRDWLGKGRYGGKFNGDTDTKLRLSEASLVAKYDISWDLQAFAHVKYDPEQDKPADLVEAYLEYKPIPTSSIRYSFKGGLFFPHISRENIGIAWTSPFTITPSAINSWVGEEIRVLGLEAKAEYRHENHRIAFTAGIFGFNDPAGTLLAFRGWGLGDAKVGAFSQLPLPHIPSIGPDSNFLPGQPFWVHPIREVDNKPGYYLAVDWVYNRNLKAGAFYYDNRGDPEVLKSQQYGWDTRFWNMYVEGEPLKGLKLIAQYMIGRTEMGNVTNNGLRYVDVDFDAGFILATKTFDEYRLSARAEWFGTDDNSFVTLDNNTENGHAFTVAASRKFGKKSSVIIEYLHINSDRPARVGLGFAEHQTNDLLQISFRKTF